MHLGDSSAANFLTTVASDAASAFAAARATASAEDRSHPSNPSAVAFPCGTNQSGRPPPANPVPRVLATPAPSIPEARLSISGVRPTISAPRPSGSAPRSSICVPRGPASVAEATCGEGDGGSMSRPF